MKKIILYILFILSFCFSWQNVLATEFILSNYRGINIVNIDEKIKIEFNASQVTNKFVRIKTIDDKILLDNTINFIESTPSNTSNNF
jgi:hypothetical protein